MKKQVAIAFYKGPPVNDIVHSISHYTTRFFTWSKWSHAELVIDGICYSSSVRDGGVRSKIIPLNTGRWDIVKFELPEQVIEQAISWFDSNKDAKYDWRNIFRFVFPFIGQDWNRYVCYEAIGEALGFAGAYRLTANDLYKWAKKYEVQKDIP